MLPPWAVRLGCTVPQVAALDPRDPMFSQKLAQVGGRYRLRVTTRVLRLCPPCCMLKYACAAAVAGG